mmetsp:Transcript_4088/g.8823  ORF Transcript_4088/g.8823 Transcript_4088/m.8823 type:complete len:477 (+) Transcript_4088:304-1734(+)
MGLDYVAPTPIDNYCRPEIERQTEPSDIWLESLLDVNDAEIEKAAAEMSDEFNSSSSDSEGSTSTSPFNETDPGLLLNNFDFPDVDFDAADLSCDPATCFDSSLPPSFEPVAMSQLGSPSDGDLLREDHTLPAPYDRVQVHRPMPEIAASLTGRTSVSMSSPSATPLRAAHESRSPMASSTSSSSTSTAATTPNLPTSSSLKRCKRKSIPGTTDAARSKRRVSSNASTRSSRSSTSGYSSSETSEPPFNAGVQPTAEMVQQMKLKKKRERNRILAAESRQRRKNHMDTLERENEDLRNRVKELEAEVAHLRSGYSNATVPYASEEDARARAHAITMKGTKLGTAAMAVAMSMVVFTDSTQGESSASSYEMISFWALGLDVLSGTGVALDSLFSHMITLLIGIAISLTIVGIYYYRVLHAKHESKDHKSQDLPFTRKSLSHHSGCPASAPFPARDTGICTSGSLWGGSMSSSSLRSR